MHEMSICLAIVEEVERLVRNAGGRRAAAITVQYGPLAGVDRESLATCFPLAAEGSLAAGAQLVLQETACRVRCRNCGLEEEALRPFDGCRSCGTLQLELLSGKELLLRNVEIETCVEPVVAGQKS